MNDDVGITADRRREVSVNRNSETVVTEQRLVETAGCKINGLKQINDNQTMKTLIIVTKCF
jgi:hypothetical protein